MTITCFLSYVESRPKKYEMIIKGRTVWGEEPEEGVGKRGSEYDQSTLYTSMKVS
jgi:hypothetical protein